MSIGQLRNQMVGEPSRVPGYAEGYGQAPGQARPSMPAQPNPIGRPSLVVGGPAYYTPPGFQAPPQPTEAFLPTDVRPDPIGQQFMRQYESPMGQQFIEQYEATQAPLRQAEQEKQQAELAKRDERFQELMDRISELEGQLGSQEEAPVMPNIPTFPIGGDFEIDFSKIPNFGNFLNFNKQMEPFEREDYQDLMSEINRNIKTAQQPQPIGRTKQLTAQELADIGYDEADVEEILERQQRKLNMPITREELTEPRITTMPVGEPVVMPMPITMPIFEPIGDEKKAGAPLPFMPGYQGEPQTSQTPQTVNLFGSDVTLGEYGKAPTTKKGGLFGGLSSATTIPMPGQGQGVNTSTIPKGMTFMGQQLIPTSTPPRKGSFLSAIRRPDLDQQQNISGPFGFARKLAKGPNL